MSFLEGLGARGHGLGWDREHVLQEFFLKNKHAI